MEHIIIEYDKSAILLEEFRTKTEFLLKDLLADKLLGFHQISSRLKDRESLSKKILRKQGYSSIKDVTDVVGCRVITYFEDEVDRVADIITGEFVIDADNSIDKRKIEFDRFGYLSLHFVASLSKNRLRLTEYKKFKGLKFEIQIRSILQHSWAEIEHDIGYKGKYSIPDPVKRRFSRIAALLETADLEFVRLRNDLKEYEKSVKKEIADNPQSVSLNKASLLSFIANNKNLSVVDNQIAKHLEIKLERDNNFTEEQIRLLEFGGVQTIQDLNEVYRTHANCIVEYSKNWRVKIKREIIGTGTGIIGISIYDTAYYLIAKNKSESDIREFFEGNISKHKKLDDEVKRCMDAYNKLNQGCR